MKRTGLTLRSQFVVTSTSTLFEVCSSLTMHEKDRTWPKKPVQSDPYFNFARGVFLKGNAWKGQDSPKEASSEWLLLQLCSRCVPPWQCMERTGLGLRSQFKVTPTSTLFKVCSPWQCMERTGLTLRSQFRVTTTSTLFEVCSYMTLHEKDSNYWPEKPFQSFHHFNFVGGVFLHGSAWKRQ